MKYSLLLLMGMVINTAYCQTVERKFQGHWGASNWIFEFRSDGTFERTEQYHFGIRSIKGRYTINDNKISVTLVSENKDATTKMSYLLDQEGLLIEVDTGYDYMLVTDSQPSDYSSRKREVKSP